VVAYNFQARFADAVERGDKSQTIRAPRKDGRHAKPGDALQLYTGMRTRACRKLRDATCHDACDVLIEADRIITFKPQELHDLEQFARHDGFASWQDMRQWFESAHGLPFRGVMIRWLVPPATRKP
jgi:hypothetical protein